MATKRLGKGLQALIADVSEEVEAKESIREIEVSRIAPNPFQPRDDFDSDSLEELKQSISSNGLITPISVRPHGSGYQLIAGERRLRAVQKLGYSSVPAYILEVDSDARMLELALVENVQRQDLNPIEEALGYQRLIEECELTQEQVAGKVGKDRATVANSVRLLKLPASIRESLSKGELSAGHARAILSVSEKNRQIELWKKTVKEQLSVRKLEKLAKATNQEKKTKKKQTQSIPYELQEAENTLRRVLGTQVRIKTQGKGGVVEVEYYGLDDLERILELMQKT